ncbi:hypothetical protein [Undibacterium flavidum]|uniref:Uncharacterized protein n=1 Tax=Undibacterium flavidum TaxID=2762297 RepID=A0ABR6YD32_9BURK|nr:hypothetical protein [Undibacterium flavidum]MBC3874438.1 hypothetical protein [Undibacterium flavidum]
MKILGFIYRSLVFGGLMLLLNALFPSHGVWNAIGLACIGGFGLIFAVFSWAFIEKFFANSKAQNK